MPTNYTRTLSTIVTKMRHCSECDCRWQPTDEVSASETKDCVILFEPTFDDQEIEKSLQHNVEEYKNDTFNNVICIECKSLATEAVDAHFKDGYVATLKEHYLSYKSGLIGFAFLFASMIVAAQTLGWLSRTYDFNLGEFIWLLIGLMIVGIIGLVYMLYSLLRILANAGDINHYIETFSEKDAKDFFTQVIRDHDDCISEMEFPKFAINALMAKE